MSEAAFRIPHFLTFLSDVYLSFLGLSPSLWTPHWLVSFWWTVWETFHRNLAFNYFTARRNAFLNVLIECCMPRLAERNSLNEFGSICILESAFRTVLVAAELVISWVCHDSLSGRPATISGASFGLGIVAHAQNIQILNRPVLALLMAIAIAHSYLYTNLKCPGSQDRPVKLALWRLSKQTPPLLTSSHGHRWCQRWGSILQRTSFFSCLDLPHW